MSTDTKPVLTVPTIHLNGTPGERLFEALEEASQSLYRARAALTLTAPNARDYYVQGDSAFKQARAEYEARARHLLEVQQELEQLMEAVRDQMDAHEAARAARQAGR